MPVDRTWPSLVKARLAPFMDRRNKSLLHRCNFNDPQELLSFFLELRRSKLVPDAVSFYLVAGQVDDIATSLLPVKYPAFWRRLHDLELRLSFDSESVEYNSTIEEYFAKHDSLIGNILREHGETDMSGLLKSDSERYDLLCEEGENAIGMTEEIGLTPPRWIEKLSDDLWNCVSGIEGFGGMDAAFRGMLTLSQVLAGPARVELIGQELDGQLAWAAFNVDLSKIINIFAKLEMAQWRSGGEEDTPLKMGGLEIAGEYSDNPVKLFIATEPIANSYDPERCDVIGIGSKH